MITTQQLQLLKEGNKNAFEALYRGYNARIYNFVLSMVSNAGVAKDITQDIFLHIWEKRLNIDLEGNFDGYLFKISQNMVYHYVRRVAFCEGIQAAAPVDSFVTPEPWDMPGYDSQVIMAAGAFIQGSSIELSADGPIKPPYSVFFQGGLTWYHAKLGILMSLQRLIDAGITTI